MPLLNPGADATDPSQIIRRPVDQGTSSSASWNQGGGWDQATQAGTPQNALQQAFAKGLTGQAAVDAANSSLGLVPPNSISYGADGSYGLPNGFYVAPNAAKGGQLDLISRGGGGGGNGSSPYGSSGFLGSPGYQYELDAANNAVQSSAAARGTLLSTGTLKDLASTDAGIAGQAFGLDTGNLLSLAQLGQGAANTAGTDITGVGNAQASGTVGSANAINAGLSGVGQATQNAYLYSLLNPKGPAVPNVAQQVQDTASQALGHP